MRAQLTTDFMFGIICSLMVITLFSGILIKMYERIKGIEKKQGIKARAYESARINTLLKIHPYCTYKGIVNLSIKQINQSTIIQIDDAVYQSNDPGLLGLEE